ncbi:hypothetical protein [Streptomyces sp. NPDC059757]|uniref:hypothetical protein n=1 Tax=Streptomyces sp. NPDC059757 TaxID=3346935 RepID=UPI00365EE063
MTTSPRSRNSRTARATVILANAVQLGHGQLARQPRPHGQPPVGDLCRDVVGHDYVHQLRTGRVDHRHVVVIHHVNDRMTPLTC